MLLRRGRCGLDTAKPLMLMRRWMPRSAQAAASLVLSPR